MFELKGMLTLHAGDQFLGGGNRIELLAQIGQTGSISAAARAVGMSYKGAWDAVNAMNNLADAPLVTRTAGGRSGGGSALTPRAERLIDVFRTLEEQHRRFVAQLDTLSDASMQDINLMRRLMIKTSARNHLAGRVVAVHQGAVNDAIELAVAGDQRLIATITRDSTQSLGLVPGREAIALIKASSVIVGLPDTGLKLSARNQLAGTVAQVTPGAVHTEVSIDLDGGGTVVAIITCASAHALGLKRGLAVLAIIKASAIILGTTD